MDDSELSTARYGSPKQQTGCKDLRGWWGKGGSWLSAVTSFAALSKCWTLSRLLIGR